MSEDERLAAHATPAHGATRRRPLGDGRKSFDYRGAFQRDRDRVVYSRSFRRLRQKAQTGILPAYEDHRRNRLTHTLEVAQLARTIGRALALNEDLIEAIALAHDLGQPPFAAAGERALDDLLRGRLDGHGGAGLGDVGGFDAARQALRVIDLLEKRYDHPGLNLTDAVRAGVLACARSHACPPEEAPGIDLDAPASPEAQAVAVADRIASALCDLDDALHAGAVTLGRVERLAAVAALKKKLGSDYPARAGRFIRAAAIHRGLVHLCVTSVVVSGRRKLAGREAIAGDELALPPATERLLAGVERLLAREVERGHAADRESGRGRRAVLGLFAAYLHDPTLLEDHVLLRYKERVGVRYLRDVPRERLRAELAGNYWCRPEFARLLADHIAAMTDPFALNEHAGLLEMGAVPIPGAEQLRRERGANLRGKR